MNLAAQDSQAEAGTRPVFTRTRTINPALPPLTFKLVANSDTTGIASIESHAIRRLDALSVDV
jgi:hypothetical protein